MIKRASLALPWQVALSYWLEVSGYMHMPVHTLIQNIVDYILWLPTALCAIIACSWYAHDIIQAFYNPFTPVNTKWVQYMPIQDNCNLVSSVQWFPRWGRGHILCFSFVTSLCSFWRYEFGSAVFIAWAGAFLVVIGGGMLAASCPRGKSTPKYPISRPPSSTKEYVWARWEWKIMTLGTLYKQHN